MKFGKRPETEWMKTSVPELRIVDDALWDAAHERMANSRLKYVRHTDGRVWGKLAHGIESKYLPTEMALCGECGGGMLVYSRGHGTGKHRRVSFCACPRSKVGLCRDDLVAPMTVADAAALSMMNDEMLAPDVVDLALKKLFARLAVPARDVAAERKRLCAALRETEAELTRLTSAIASGDAPETLLSGIREREAKRKHLTAELNALDAGPAAVTAAPAIRAEAMRLLDDWRRAVGEAPRREATGLAEAARPRAFVST